ncbi:MAG: ABC transporter permease [Chloroflexota bacterium]|nr:ABC transporter permease [Chloroflexota bacterium]
MNLRIAWRILLKDLRLGPRSPILLWAIIFPVVGTLLVQLVFGSLFAPQPRLGIVDEGGSQVAAAMAEVEGIELRLIGTEDGLTQLVKTNDLDAGLVLPTGFDEQVQAGAQPPLQFFVGGESLASNRLILAVTTLDAVRSVEGSTPPVEVEVVSTGDPLLPMSSRMMPLLVLFALLIAGVFVPAFSIVGERESGTMTAMLVSPARGVDVLAAKAVMGMLLGMLMALVTLWLNDALSGQPLALLLSIGVAAVMLAEVGLLFGSSARDAKTLFALMKSVNILLFAPVIFYIFPDWPQWIAQVFPTYYIINPIFEVAVRDATLTDIAWQLVVAVIISLALIPLVVVMSRRMTQQVSAA